MPSFVPTTFLNLLCNSSWQKLIRTLYKHITEALLIVLYLSGRLKSGSKLLRIFHDSPLKYHMGIHIQCACMECKVSEDTKYQSVIHS